MKKYMNQNGINHFKRLLVVLALMGATIVHASAYGIGPTKSSKQQGIQKVCKKPMCGTIRKMKLRGAL